MYANVLQIIRLSVLLSLDLVLFHLGELLKQKQMLHFVKAGCSLQYKNQVWCDRCFLIGKKSLSQDVHVHLNFTFYWILGGECGSLLAVSLW